MKGITRRLLAGLSALAIVATSGVPAVFAEGSRELSRTPDGVSADDAYRPYLEWRYRDQLGELVVDGKGNAVLDSQDNEQFTNTVKSKSVFYAYAKAGETVYFGQSNHSASARSIAAVVTNGDPTDAEIAKIDTSLRGSTIAVTLPTSDKKVAYDPSNDKTGAVYKAGSAIESAAAGDKSIYLFKPEDKKGIITNVVEEQTGPKYGTDAERNTYGYEPFSFVAPVEGTYAFRFLSIDYRDSESAAIPSGIFSEGHDKASPAPTPAPVYSQLPKNTLVTFTGLTAEKTYKADDVVKSYIKVLGDGIAINSSGSEKPFGTGTATTTTLYFEGSKNSAGGEGRTIEITPKEDGKLELSVNGASGRTIYFNSDDNPAGELDGSLKTVSLNVKAGVPVKIYSKGGGWWLYGVRLVDQTFNISTESSTDGVGAVTSVTEAAAGTTVTVDPSNEEYRFDTIAVTGASGAVATTKVSDTEYTFVMPSEDVTVTASFAEKTKYAVTVDPAAHGAVASNRNEAPAGSTVTITVGPDTYYALDTLTVTGASGAVATTKVSDTTYNFTMPAEAVTVNASFAIEPVVWPFNDLKGVTITYTDNKYDYNGLTVYNGGTLSQSGYAFGGATTSSNNRIIEYTPDADGTLEVEIEPQGTSDIRVGAIGTNYTKTISGTVTADKVTALVSDDPGVVLDAKGVEGSGAKATMTASLQAGKTYYIYSASGGVRVTNITFTATEPGVTYNVNVSASTNGTVTASPSSAAEGRTVTLNVTPATGYELDTLTVTDAESNSVTVTNNTFTMPASDVTVTATFKAKPSYTISVDSTVANGTVSADKASATEGETVTLTVTPATGYELDTLTVTDASSNSVTVTNNTFTMPASNVTVTASFKEEEVVIEPITWDFSDSPVSSLAAADPPNTATYNGLTLVGHTTKAVSIAEGNGFQTGGTSSATTRHIVYTPEYDGTLAVTFASSGDSNARIVAIGTQVVTGANVTSETDGVLAAAGVLGKGSQDTITANLTKGTTYYVYAASNAANIQKLVFTPSAASTSSVGGTGALSEIASSPILALQPVFNSLSTANSLMGTASLSGTTKVLYERGYETAWAPEDVTEWGANNGIVEEYGLSQRGGNSSHSASISISPTANSKITVDAVWYGQANLNRGFDAGNAEYFSFGNVSVLQHDQTQASAVAFSALSADVIKDANKNNKFTISNAYRKTYGDPSSIPAHVIHMEINTATNTLETLTVQSSAPNSKVVKTVSNVTLTDPVYNIIKMGHFKSGSTTTTNYCWLKSIRITEETQELDTAEYTINYTLDDETIKTTTGTAVDGDTVYSDVTFTKDETKYFAVSGEAASLIVTKGGTNVLNVPVRVANKYTVKLIASTDSRELSSQENVVEGEDVTLYYPRYILGENGVAYWKNNTNRDSYGTDIKNVDGTNITATINYTESPYDNVVYLSEAEKVTGMTAGDDTARQSMGKGAYAGDSSITLCPLEPGTYQIVTAGRQLSGSGSSTFSFKTGDTEVHSYTTTGTFAETTSEAFTVDEQTNLTISGGVKNYLIDYILVDKIAAIATVDSEVAENVKVGDNLTSTTANIGTSVGVTVTAPEGQIVSEVYYTTADGTKVTIEKDASGNYAFTMPASNVTVSATFEENVEPTTLAVPFTYNGETVYINTITLPSGLSKNESYLYYVPAYVTDGTNWYKVNNTETYSRAVTLTGVNTTAEAEAVTLDEDVVAFVETEDIPVTSGIKDGERYIGSADSSYSSGGYSYFNATSGSRTTSVSVNIPEAGVYELSGPLVVLSADSANSRSLDASLGSATKTVWANKTDGGTISVLNYLDAGTTTIKIATTERNKTSVTDYVIIKKAQAYTVTANAAENGEITPDAEIAGEGQTVTVTATPAEGYKLDTLTVTDANGDPVTVTNNSFTMPAANVTISAEFVLDGWNSLTLATAGSGTLTAANGETAVASGTLVQKETELTISAVAAAGYRLASVVAAWTDSEGERSQAISLTDGSGTFTMPDADVTITATFGENVITITTPEGGTVTLNSDCYVEENGIKRASPNNIITGSYAPAQYYTYDSTTVVQVIDGVTGASVPTTVDKEAQTFTFTMPENSVIITVTFNDARQDLFVEELPKSDSKNTYTAKPTIGIMDNIISDTIAQFDPEQYLAIYSSATGYIGTTDSSAVWYQPSLLETTSGTVDTINGVLEVIPKEAGILELDVTGASSSNILKMAQTDSFTAASIKSNTIAVSKDGTKMRAVVVPHVPVYIYAEGSNISFNSAKLVSSTDYASDEWRLADGSTPLIGAWDITVVDGESEKSGRVWTDIFFMNAKNHRRSLWSKVNILSNDAYEYEFDFNGLMPYSFLFYSNNRGFLQDKVGVDGTRSVQGLLHSFYSYAKSGMGRLPQHLEKSGFVTKVYSNFTPYDPEIDHTNRLFINEVNTDAMQAYTGQAEHKTASHENPAGYILPRYIGYGGNADNTEYSNESVENGHVKNGGVVEVNKGTKGLGGKFVFTISEDVNNPNYTPSTESSSVTVGSEVLKNLNGISYSIKLDFSGFKLDSKREPVTTDATYTDPVTGEVFAVEEWKPLAEGETPSDFEKNNIVMLSTFIHGANTYNLIWDGRDAYGNEVPVTVDNVDSYPVHRYTEAGVIHMPMVDVERLPNGVKVHRLGGTADGTAATSEATLSETRDDSWDIYYNNYAVSPSFWSTSGDTSSTITELLPISAYNTDTTGTYDWDNDSSWYFTGRQYNSYPSQIGDGTNAITGVSTQSKGAMEVGDFLDKDKSVLGTDSNKTPTRSTGLHEYLDSKGEKWSNIGDNEQSYGDRAALDMWASVISDSLPMNVGVNPNTFTTMSTAIVSYVDENGTNDKAELKDTPFTGSHIAAADGTRIEYSHNVGRPGTPEYEAAVEAGTQDDLKSFGNTISTAFLSELTSGPTNHTVVDAEGIAQTQPYEIEGILWTITIPKEDAEKNYVKLGSDKSGYASGWSTLNGSNSALITDSPTVTIKDQEIELPITNEGSIYKMADGSYEIKIKHKIPAFSVPAGLSKHVVVGLVLDNIYAPNATALATYVDADDVVSYNGTEKQTTNMYTRETEYTEMSAEDGALVPGIIVTIEEMGGAGADEANKKNAFYTHKFNKYTGGLATTLSQEEAQLFAKDFAVSFWETDEEIETIDDIIGAESEMNTKSDEIYFEDLSDGVETIDDILGYNFD